MSSDSPDFKHKPLLYPEIFHQWDTFRNTTDTTSWDEIDWSVWFSTRPQGEWDELWSFYKTSTDALRIARRAHAGEAAFRAGQESFVADRVASLKAHLAEEDLLSSPLPTDFSHPVMLPQTCTKELASTMTTTEDLIVVLPVSHTEPITSNGKDANEGAALLHFSELNGNELMEFRINQVNKDITIPNGTPGRRAMLKEKRTKAFGRSYTLLFEEAEGFRQISWRYRIVAIILKRKANFDFERLIAVLRLAKIAADYEGKAVASRTQGEQNKALATEQKKKLKEEKEAAKMDKKEDTKALLEPQLERQDEVSGQAV